MSPQLIVTLMFIVSNPMEMETNHEDFFLEITSPQSHDNILHANNSVISLLMSFLSSLHDFWCTFKLYFVFLMVQGAKKNVAYHISYALFHTRNEVHCSQNTNCIVLEENKFSHPFLPHTKSFYSQNESHSSMCPYSLSQL